MPIPNPGLRPDLGSIPGNMDSLSRRRPDLGTIPFEDSGVESYEYSKFKAENNDTGSDSIPELEEALLKLNPQEVEQKRKRMFSMSRYSFELGSDGGFESPGSSIFGHHQKGGFLPYGVRTPDSLSIGSRDFSAYGQGWKLPDKLRIVKPLEGSLTLHQWQRLAKPSLGGIFEERKGVVQRGFKNPVEPESEMESDLEDEDEVRLRLKTGATRLQQTLTNSKILHPDVTEVTSTYGKSSRISSMQSSRRESICSSMDDLRMNFGTTTFSTNLGLAYVLNERNIHGGSTLSLDQQSRMGSSLDLRSGPVSRSSEVASICSLTPSVMHSPKDISKSFSPTGTPLNSPIRPSSPTRETDADNPGFVLGFFASLRTALYGEQQKEVKHIRKSKKNQKKLGILQKVQEVGPERFLSPAPLEEESEVSELEDSVEPLVKSFHENDFDELEDITPGLLTISRGIKPKPTLDLFGELKAPTDEMPKGRGPGRIVSPGDKRPNLPGGYGVPGKTGTGALQRSDLGSIPTSSMSLIHEQRMHMKPADEHSFIGTLTTMFFGRKGGLL